jgi:hypothetical protein
MRGRAGTEGSPGYGSAFFQLLQCLLSRFKMAAYSFSLVIHVRQREDWPSRLVAGNGLFEVGCSVASG